MTHRDLFPVRSAAGFLVNMAAMISRGEISRRKLVAVYFCACLSVLLGDSKDRLQWQNVTVIYAHYELSHSGDVAAQGISQSVREQFDLDAGDVTYTVEDWVVPNQRLRLQEGAVIQCAIDGKKVVLKTPDGKTRNMKLVARYPKSQRKKTP